MIAANESNEWLESNLNRHWNQSNGLWFGQRAVDCRFALIRGGRSQKWTELLFNSPLKRAEFSNQFEANTLNLKFKSSSPAIKWKPRKVVLNSKVSNRNYSVLFKWRILLSACWASASPLTMAGCVRIGRRLVLQSVWMCHWLSRNCRYGVSISVLSIWYSICKDRRCTFLLEPEIA